jgi:hypothetical protein
VSRQVLDTYRLLRFPSVRRKLAVRQRILEALDSPEVILQGPFQGMRYRDEAHGSELLPKILGSYEAELVPAIEAICGAGCDRIIDIGAAEGYYVVGLALRNPHATVVGFEQSHAARRELRKLVAHNGVENRVIVEGTCDVQSLAIALEPAARPAVICDCEGAEDQLLNPDQVEPLKRSLILVETHDGLEQDGIPLSGIVDRLVARFEPTHAIETIASRPRTLADLPPGASLDPEDALEAMCEGRPRADWLFLTPRSPVAA